MGKCGRKCVGVPHLNTLHYTYPIPLPHIPPPHANTLPHSPHTLYHTSPLPTHLSLLIPTHFPTSPPHSLYLFPQLPSPPQSPHAPSHTSPHIFPHGLDYVVKLPCDDVALVNLTGLWKSSTKFFTTTGNFKSCFGVGNVKFSMYESVAKLPCGKVTGNQFGCQ